MTTEIRVTRGVGSSPKLWAVIYVREPGRKRYDSQVGEFDVSDEPGWMDETAMGGMTGIVWKRGRIAETYPRRTYASPEEWIADLMAEYPEATFDVDLNANQSWL